MLADANLFAESAGGPTTHSDRRPNDEGQSVVLKVFNRRVAVLKVSSGCQDFARFSTCLRLLHEPLPNRKSASLLRQLTTESLAPTLKSAILLCSSDAFSMSIGSLFETVEGIGKPEERQFVRAVLAGFRYVVCFSALAKPDCASLVWPFSTVLQRQALQNRE